MKIGLMIGRSYSKRGGIAHVAYAIRDALCQEHEVVTYTCAKIPWLENNKYLIPFPFARTALLQITGPLLCNMARDCDILVYPAALFSISANKRPIIVYSHAGFPTYDTSKHSWILKLYGRVFGHASDNTMRNIREGKNIHILTNAQYTTALVRNDSGRDATVIYPSVDIEKFTSPIAKQRYGVVSIGTLTPRKNYLDLCEVMTHIKAPYTIMGNMLHSHERIHCDALRVKYPDAQIVPNTSEQVIMEKLWASKVYLHGKIEDFGISIVEAVAAGCVPIVPDGGGIRETIPIQELRFEPGNLDAIREKVKTALSGGYDHYMPELQSHVRQYDTSVFNRKISDYVQGLDPRKTRSGNGAEPAP